MILFATLRMCINLYKPFVDSIDFEVVLYSFRPWEIVVKWYCEYEVGFLR